MGAKVPTRCPVCLRAWAGGEFRCRLKVDHGPEHRASGLYPDQTLVWLDGDRRAFTREFTPCDESTCILPAGHRGRHAA